MNYKCDEMTGTQLNDEALRWSRDSAQVMAEAQCSEPRLKTWLRTVEEKKPENSRQEMVPLNGKSRQIADLSY